MRKRVTTESFIEDAVKIHGHKYDYSKVKYNGMKNGVCIICPEHGEFMQTPYKHLIGRGCPLCGIRKNSESRRLTINDFIEKANKIHDNKYDYSKVNYTGNHNKVCIICKEHGEFWQEPAAHLSGQGCPKCGIKCATLSRRSDSEEFIKKAKIIHGDKYDYSKVVYLNSDTKVSIICPEHGEFSIQPKHHLAGCGCQKCSIKKRSEEKKLNIEEFIKKANRVHNYKYDYSKAEYVDSKTKLCIICPEHGEFWQTPNDHLRGNGCRNCVNLQSNQEIEICNFLKDNNIEYLHGSRPLIDGKEIDIYIPEHKLGIEFDGLYWHSDEFVLDNDYHLKKTLECEKNGIVLIHIFEDEWKFKKKIILSKLKHLLKLDKQLPRIMGRKCLIKEICTEDAFEFLEKNHIQGYGNGKIKIGAYYNNKLVGVMVFKEEKRGEWVLNRFATDIHMVCQGIGGKLLSFFEKNYAWKKIKSFADRRWTSPNKMNLYMILGFNFDGVTKPDYRYVVKNERKHKFNFRKTILSKKYGLPIKMTETKMTKKLGFHRIYDCGLIKYSITNNER